MAKKKKRKSGLPGAQTPREINQAAAAEYLAGTSELEFSELRPGARRMVRRGERRQRREERRSQKRRRQEAQTETKEARAAVAKSKASGVEEYVRAGGLVTKGGRPIQAPAPWQAELGLARDVATAPLISGDLMRYGLLAVGGLVLFKLLK